LLIDQAKADIHLLLANISFINLIINRQLFDGGK